MTSRIRHNQRIIASIILILLIYITPIYYVLKYSNHFEESVVISLIGSAVALITGILALLKDFIIDAINAPSIKILFFPNDNRDCHQTEFTSITTLSAGPILHRTKTHYFRFRVKNIGWKTAEDLEVNIEEVRKYKDGTFQIDKDFLPIRLHWSNWREQRLELDIPTDTYRHCDFGFIIEPNKIVNNLPSSIDGAYQFWFDAVFRPNVGRTSLSPGCYQIIICATGKNVNKTSLTIEMEWKGGWQNKIEDMYADYLKVIKIS